jgi:hypothetical protein
LVGAEVKRTEAHVQSRRSKTRPNRKTYFFDSIGQSRHFRPEANMSGLPPIATESVSRAMCCDVPTDARTCSKLFDHFVSDGKQLRRHGKAKHSGSLGINDQFELA